MQETMFVAPREWFEGALDDCFAAELRGFRETVARMEVRVEAWFDVPAYQRQSPESLAETRAIMAEAERSTNAFYEQRAKLVRRWVSPWAGVA